MRADRLLSMLMLLQTNEQMTAGQLAQQLDVSERTIYRDITALCEAGIPVCTQGGPGGGISLVENYQTSLTGLRTEEAQALSLLSVPEPLMHLGLGEELKNALLKLSAAVPSSVREKQALVRQRIHLDAAAWFQEEENNSFLPVVQKALWQDQLLHLVWQGDFDTRIDQVVAPYGLVAKASKWYLVFALDTHLQARPVSQILSAEVLPDRFIRPPAFDLEQFWLTWSAEYESDRPRYIVHVLVSPSLASVFQRSKHTKQMDITGDKSTGGKNTWQPMTLTFDSFESARTRILGFGGAIEVLDPIPLRLSVADFARQLLTRYKDEE